MARLAEQPLILEGTAWDDYGLVDSGDGRKLERYGPYRFIRPEPQAMWQPRFSQWEAQAEFVPGSDEDGGGRWLYDNPVPEDGWPLKWREVEFTAQCTPFRHLGFFPDMAPVWDWMRDQLDGKADAQTLNLFGYTGVGSLALKEISRASERECRAGRDGGSSDSLAGRRCGKIHRARSAAAETL
jgi:23S rRNA (cytosine1962-C5)-methyltransferase